MDLEFKSTNAAGPILIVGDGDFSFSVAFCKRYDTLFTTSNLESYGEMEYKYPNFADNVQFLQSHGRSLNIHMCNFTLLQFVSAGSTHLQTIFSYLKGCCHLYCCIYWPILGQGMS